MQTINFRRVLAGLILVCSLAACSGSAENPYLSLKDPPLAAGKLHTVTLVTEVSPFSMKSGRPVVAVYVAVPATAAADHAASTAVVAARTAALRFR